MVIFAAGTGNPFFTTDTAAALRAAEMGCDALFKGTSVDGVYDADPKKVRGAKRYETVSFDKVLSDNLKVMDATAVALCRDNNIPIVVFNIREQGNLARVLGGEGTATIVQNEGEMTMPAYDKARHPAPHARRGRGAEARSRRPAHRPRLDRLARSDPCRGLRREHAAQPGRDRLRARAAHALGPGLGPLERRPGREGDPQSPGSASTRSSTARTSACRSRT